MRIEIPAYALTDKELWTPDLVLRAHAHAERVFRALPARIGPAGPRTVWPIYASEPEDEVPDEEPPFRPSRADITRAEWVLLGFSDQEGGKHPAWRNGALMGYPEQRRVFLRWSKWSSFGRRAPDGVPETEEEFAERIRMSYATLRRHRDFSAGMVAMSLNQVGLTVWHSEKARRKNNRHATASV